MGIDTGTELALSVPLFATLCDRRLFCAITVLGLALLCTVVLGALLIMFRDTESVLYGLWHDVRFLVEFVRKTAAGLKSKVWK